MTHILLSHITSRFGGRKIPGREEIEPLEMHHWTPEELAAHIAALEADGRYLTVTILACKDKRRVVAKNNFPMIICSECGGDDSLSRRQQIRRQNP